MIRSLTEIKRQPLEAVLAGLLSDSVGQSTEAGMKLVAKAKDYGIGVRDYLTLAVDVRGSKDSDKYGSGPDMLSGYEASLAYLNLPVRNDYKNGIVLAAASETFQTFAGTRALFPAVIDDVLRWDYRQDQFEQVAPMLSNSRTIVGNELISTVVNDVQADSQVAATIAEGARFPTKSIRTSELSVKMYKHGSALRTTYEFARRARLDLLTPYAARINRELEISKVAAATSMLINGDGLAAHGAAAVLDQSDFDSTATNGTLSYKGLLAWFVARAKAGLPIDTVAGDWDAYLQWLNMFAIPQSANGTGTAANLANAGFVVRGVPILKGTIDFVISSAMSSKKLLGFSRGDTLEELVEAGSQISESEQSILNQTVTYVKSENTGYHLVYGDTRSIYDYNA